MSVHVCGGPYSGMEDMYPTAVSILPRAKGVHVTGGQHGVHIYAILEMDGQTIIRRWWLEHIHVGLARPGTAVRRFCNLLSHGNDVPTYYTNSRYAQRLKRLMGMGDRNTKHEMERMRQNRAAHKKIIEHYSKPYAERLAEREAIP